MQSRIHKHHDGYTYFVDGMVLYGCPTLAGNLLAWDDKARTAIGDFGIEYGALNKLCLEIMPCLFDLYPSKNGYTYFILCKSLYAVPSSTLNFDYKMEIRNGVTDYYHAKHFAYLLTRPF